MILEIEANVSRPNGFHLVVEEKWSAHATGIAGPSGGGKTTLLNCITGSERGARVIVDGEDWSEWSMQERKIGYVTQDPLLFPHMTVKENLLYSPRASSIGPIAEMLRIDHLLERRPANLSGGEKRRVALGRAIASQPRLLVLDEPFTGLDEILRREAMSVLHSIKQWSGVPMILVSHLADEIVGLTDWTIRLENGSVSKRGPSESVLNETETRIDNYFSGIILEPGLVRCGSCDLKVILPHDADGPVRLACYANDILLSKKPPDEISARNVIPTKIKLIQGFEKITLVDLEAPSLRVLVTREANRDLDLVAGMSIYAIIKASSIVYLGPAEN